MIELTYEMLYAAASDIAENLVSLPPLKLYGVPRGGIYAAMILHSYLPGSSITEDPESADVIVDDICDSGRTLSKYDNKIYAALVARKGGSTIADLNYGMLVQKGKWVIFPWEKYQAPTSEGISSTVKNRLEYEHMPYDVHHKIGSMLNNEELGMLRSEIQAATLKFLDTLVIQHYDTTDINDVMRRVAESYLDGSLMYRYLGR